jgi:plasmid stabilization system protein ParE
MVMNVIWTPPATNDLENIFNFYKGSASDTKAQEIIDLIIDATEIFTLDNLTTKEIGQVELDLQHRNRGYRYLVESHFKIIYFIDKKNIVITHVFDTRQDPGKKQR